MEWVMAQGSGSYALLLFPDTLPITDSKTGKPTKTIHGTRDTVRIKVLSNNGRADK
jgi:hypothetical protein